MAKINVIYVIVGEKENDGIWAIKIDGKSCEMLASDAPSPNLDKEQALKFRVGNLLKMAESIAIVTGKKYKLCKFVFEKEVHNGLE